MPRAFMSTYICHSTMHGLFLLVCSVLYLPRSLYVTKRQFKKSRFLRVFLNRSSCLNRVSGHLSLSVLSVVSPRDNGLRVWSEINCSSAQEMSHQVLQKKLKKIYKNVLIKYFKTIPMYFSRLNFYCELNVISSPRE